jgi:hypothetical protein
MQPKGERTIGQMGNTTKVRGGRLQGVGQQDQERSTRGHTYQEYNMAIVTYKEKREWAKADSGASEVQKSRVQCSVTGM